MACVTSRDRLPGKTNMEPRLGNRAPDFEVDPSGLIWSGSPDSTGPDLKGEVMRSKPQIDSAMELFKFVLAFAGGKRCSYLIATDEFVRAHGHPMN